MPPRFSLRNAFSRARQVRTSRNTRATREFVRGLFHTEHPLLVHIVPVRRCNIACGYCNEYDDVSNDQRKVIYQQRNELLESVDISETIRGMIAAPLSSAPHGMSRTSRRPRACSPLSRT